MARCRGGVPPPGGSSPDRWRALADTARALRGASLNDETDRLQAALDVFPMPGSPSTDVQGYVVHVLIANLLLNRSQLWCGDQSDYDLDRE